MVRHDHHRMTFFAGKFIGYFVIPFFGHFSGIVQDHFSIDDLPKQARPVLAADGNKIKPGLCVIISFQAYGPAVMVCWIVHRIALVACCKTGRFCSICAYALVCAIRWLHHQNLLRFLPLPSWYAVRYRLYDGAAHKGYTFSTVRCRY